jgi:hypothetical protein
MITSQSSNQFVMPYLLTGEIIEVLKDQVKDENDEPIAVAYNVYVNFPNGSKTILHNVIQASLFGGIGDFSQFRLRASKDVKFDVATDSKSAKITSTTVGDKVLIAFVSGDLRRPIIIGCLPHSQRAFDLPDIEGVELKQPQGKVAYNGFEFQSNEKGESTFTNRGSPQVKDTDAGLESKLLERTDVGPKELPARESKTPLPADVIPPNVPPKILPKASIPVTENPALIYPDEKYTTEEGFLELGEWYVVDNEGQTIFLDRDSKTLTISNGNDLIQIDKEHKKIFFQSTGDMEITTALDYAKSVKGDQHVTIDKNEMSLTKEDEYTTVGGSRTANIVDKDTSTIGNAWTVTIGTAKEVEQGKGKLGAKHSATLALSTGNTITMDDDNCWMIHRTGAMLTLTKEGNAMLMGKDGSMLSIDATNGTVNLISKKGVMFSVGEKILLSSKSGKEFVSVKDDEVTIASGKNVNINAASVAINAGNISVGDKATFSAVNGENMMTWLTAHVHGSAVGLTSPATIPPATYTMTPLDLLSKSVKIRK